MFQLHPSGYKHYNKLFYSFALYYIFPFIKYYSCNLTPNQKSLTFKEYLIIKMKKKSSIDNINIVRMLLIILTSYRC